MQHKLSLAAFEIQTEAAWGIIDGKKSQTSLNTRRNVNVTSDGIEKSLESHTSGLETRVI